MRKVREVLRLKHALGMSYRKISEATGAGKTQAAEYVRRAEAAGIGWPIPMGSTIQSSSGDCSRSPRTVQISALPATGRQSNGS